MKASAALLALAAALLATQAWRTSPAPDTSRAADIAKAQGPTADSAARRLFRDLGSQPPHVLPSAEISLTDNQELIPDFALHALIDSFLLNRSDAGRLQALSDHLHRTLPSAAADEAMRIATRYQAYLAAHDELLAAQHFTSGDATSLDLSRLISWQQQRQQLRVRMLGERIALEWFGNDETYVTQALDEWRLRQGGEPSAPASEDQARHDQHMRQALNQLAAKAN